MFHMKMPEGGHAVMSKPSKEKRTGKVEPGRQEGARERERRERERK